MFDPIGGFLRIRDLFITYLETAFRIGDPGVSRERRALLESPGQLCTAPLLEPLPRYARTGWPLRELPNLDGGPLSAFPPDVRRAFMRLALAGLFDRDDIRLYAHQAEMLGRGVKEGHPGVVTSGTGSGKTESFLLPVLATIIREAKGWSRPEDSYLQQAWWRGPDGQSYKSYSDIPKNRRPLKKNPSADPFVPHRRGERRAAAVRCLVLYPMNALVEDQLSRLRKALDSDDARAVLDEEIASNRIFFGRYTSDTPVTGFNVHPRLRPEQDYPRRGRQLGKLFQEMVQFEQTQREVRRQAEEPSSAMEESHRFLFPSVDGSELLCRRDMQQHPPDILITNVSMLGAMLNREVDAPIFDETKAWLTENDDAYFFLVLDELHLQRGAAGTEVAYLLRLLLHRLGLTEAKHRHKVRILASSASLPTTGDEADRSRTYLWDMFGSFGTWQADRGGATDPSYWASAIVAGEQEPEVPRGKQQLEPGAFEAFLLRHGGTTNQPACSNDAFKPPLIEDAWRGIAQALGNTHAGPLPVVVRDAVEEAGRRLAAACWSANDQRPRATQSDLLSRKLFDGSESGLDALRGLLLVRGLGDAYATWFPDEPAPEAPAFRLHTFFRSIEGMYAPLNRGGGVEPTYRSDDRVLGPLSLDRGTTASASKNSDPQSDGLPPPRLLELLYCECCGEGFVGGMRRARGKGEFEMLPAEAELDGLPDIATSQLFEDLSFDQYCVFWPTTRTTQPTVAIDGGPESWAFVHLDPSTAVLRTVGPTGSVPQGNMTGWLFTRAERQDRHKRRNQHRGTNVPYECPSCETDYSPRRIESGLRLSPIRHFRTGFAKTTQLLASELFHLLKLHSREPKLVSFSDSRQDAAKAALDVESRHHEDVRRDVLVNELRAYQSTKPSADELDARLVELRRLRGEAEDRNDADEDERLSAAIKDVNRKRAAASEGTVCIGDILEDPRHPKFFLGPAENREPLKPLIRRFVTLGIHPVHPAGTRKFKAEVDGKTRWFDWNELFITRGETFDWRDDARDQPFLDDARRQLVLQIQRLVTEIAFSRTYFSLEEAGLGYLCLPKKGLPNDSSLFDKTSAFLRVFGDAYRMLDSPYDHPPGPWSDATSIPSANRVSRLASAAQPGNVRAELQWILERLSDAGHKDGLLATASLRVKLASPSDPYWRCSKCARVHLHRGVQICTRCFAPLTENATGQVREIVATNFLSKRLGRTGAEAFRLHCEELTGQTDDGADRQRKFRGVLFSGFHPKLDADGNKVLDEDDEEILVANDPFFLPAREEIDLLAVTTTMEVGIDIGPLQAILQANMPPQRFNYQQRVGRAGRRGQAYSLVLTVCRTKSHDLYYFREPNKITGDVPPPPFLTKKHPSIARRFLRKWWLNVAFASKRGTVRPWPADQMRPPDIHGEFTPTDDYFNGVWKPILREALEATESSARDMVHVLAENSAITFDDIWTDAPVILDEIDEVARRRDSRRYGLAHSLAERGSLPMYGMPTRVRDLYVDTRPRAGGQTEWSTIDRDLELAIYEFAPGSVIVKDKREHLCVGFTGPILPFHLRRPPGPSVTPMSEAFGEPFWMIECSNCGSWYRVESKPTEDIGDCRSCLHSLNPQRSAECREPLGFRTNFRPNAEVDTDGPSGRHRSIQSEPGTRPFEACSGSNLSIALEPEIKTYRLNRGPVDPDVPGSWDGFSAVLGAQRLVRGRAEAVLENQMIARDFVDGGDKPSYFSEYGDDRAERIERVWLAAPKTTDALYLAPTGVPEGIGVSRIVGPRTLEGLVGGEVIDALGRTAVRAAALSATFILVNRAALDLDIDPEEFDIIEPRLARPAGGPAVPILQFADHLVNGAGFCISLGSKDATTGVARIATLLHSALSDKNKYPLDDLLRGDHPATCEQSCYKCLLRYRNQPFHGILDWRLGLAFLHLLADGSFRCGLDGAYESAALADWTSLVGRDVQRMKRQFSRLKTIERAGVHAVKFDGTQTWAVIGHPLWDPTAPSGVLLDAINAVEGEFVVVDSFNVARRPATIRRALLDAGHDA